MITVSDYKFTRQQRLLVPTQFSHTFDHNEYRFSTPYLLVLVAEAPACDYENRQNHEDHIAIPGKLGLVVAKKHLKRAVDRNTFKRITRDSFRLNQHRLHGLYCVVLARSKAKEIGSAELRSTLEQAWSYILRKRKRRSGDA